MSRHQLYNLMSVGVLFTLLCLSPYSVFSQGIINKNAWVVKSGHFAISTETYGDTVRRPIITYLPPGLLLFNLDRSQKINDGDERVLAQTQNDVKVYAIDKVINSISVYGNRDYVAHATFSICTSLNCNPQTDLTTSINAGNFFTVKEIKGIEIYEIFANRTSTKDESQGFISKKQIKNLSDKGVVTNLRQKHPRYNIKKRNAVFINAACGQEYSKSYPKTSRDNNAEVDRVALRIFNYGKIESNNRGEFHIKIEKPYGGNHIAHEFVIYEIQELSTPNSNQTPKNFLIFAEIRYKCDNDDDKVFITRVRIIRVDEQAKDSEASIKFQMSNGTTFAIPDRKFNTTGNLEPGKTPEDLAGNKFGRHPYLWSINTPEQYLELAASLTKIFSNRSIVGYFIAEYNRSCPRELRNSKDEGCVGHSYKDFK